MILQRLDEFAIRGKAARLSFISIHYNDIRDVKLKLNDFRNLINEIFH